MLLIDILKEAIVIAKEKRKQYNISKEWFNIALAYNRIHTYSSSMPEAKWMCPMCHTIHESYEHSLFTGLQFPKCCVYQAGPRLDKEYATDISNIKRLNKPTERHKL